MVLTPPYTVAQGPRSPLDALIIVVHVRDYDTSDPMTGAFVELLDDSGATLEQATVGWDGKVTLTPSWLPRSRRLVVVARAPGFEEARTQIQFYRRQRQATAWLFLKPVATFYSEVAEEVRAATPEARQELLQALQIIGEKGEPGAAIEHLRKAVKAHPGFVEAHYLLGSLLLDVGRLDEAEQEFRTTMKLNPDFAPSYISLGTLRNRQGMFPEAQEFLEKGMALDPEDWAGRVELVRALHRQGNLKEAERRGLEAHELNPSAPEVHLLLADVYVVEGASAKARQEYEHFLALIPQGPLADRVRQQITKLEEGLQQK